MMLHTCAASILSAVQSLQATHSMHSSLHSTNLLCLCSAVVDVQNKLTNDVLEQCKTRGAFKELLTKVFNYPRFSCPFKRGNRCGQQSDACPAATFASTLGSLALPFGFEKHV